MLGKYFCLLQYDYRDFLSYIPKNIKNKSKTAVTRNIETFYANKASCKTVIFTSTICNYIILQSWSIIYHANNL